MKATIVALAAIVVLFQTGCLSLEATYCKDKADGDYIDPTTCYGFISCSNGLVHHMPCPSNLKWDDSKKRCEYVGNPKCSGANPPYYKCNSMSNKNKYCNNKANGNYPDPTNCYGYIACSNGLVYHMPCPSNLKWNDKKKYCDWPANAYPACPGPTTAPPTQPPTTSSGGNYCDGKANGDYPDPTNCNGFISCSNGITYHMPCPAGLYWNDNTKRCDYPQNAHPPCNNQTNHPQQFNCSKHNGDQSNFCKDKANGNYPNPNNCHGYIACSNGYIYYMPCPANLYWNQAKNQCDWPHNANPPCNQGSQTTATPVKTTPSSFCVGKKDGDYPDPTDCSAYITCSNQNTHSERPCPAGLKWNDIKKQCDWPQFATGKCGPNGCADILSVVSCNRIKARSECNCAGGLYCPKTCNRC